MNEAHIQQILDKIVDLETQLAFQEDTISRLDAIVIKQQTQMENLNEMLKDTQGKLQSLADNPSVSMVDEKPPHY